MKRGRDRLARTRLRRLLAGLAAATIGASPATAGPTIPELVEVADIVSLSASPSGRWVAFRVERPSIERNSYTIDWYVADPAGGTVRRIGSGGAPIYGDAGPLEAETIVWSPDERSLYHRALVDGAIGLWRTAVDGSGSRAVVLADADVERLQVGPDGRSLTYELGPSRDEIERAEQREYDDGILVDSNVDLAQPLFRGGSVNGRMASQRLTGRWYGRAGLLWRAPRNRYRLDLATLEASGPEKVAPPPVTPLAPTKGIQLSLEAPGHDKVTASWNGKSSRLQVERNQQTVACAAELCRTRRAVAVAWRPGSDELTFTTQDGHFRQALHLWNVGRGTVRSVALGEGLLSGSRDPTRPCAFTPSSAICVAAGAVAPPRLERIDLRSGARTTLFDPNIALRERPTARVEQMTWTLADGRAATATVLLPRQGKEAAPFFVSYYHCPGYLRGGTGDEFPSAALVDAGFAVACLNMVSQEDPADALGRYRTALTSVESLIRLLAGRGLVDSRRVAMGGFSAGSEATMWVAMNSDLLAAAAIASPQYEPSSYWRDAVPGRDFARVLRDFIGLGTPEETPERWRLISPALNTQRIKAPLLMQMPEEEARSAWELHSRLSGTSTPVEMYAFPDEGHVKMQPRHRQAVYRRNLDWFRYWLQGHVDPDPAKAEQYRRWGAQRRRRDLPQPENERSQVSAAEISRRRM